MARKRIDVHYEGMDAQPRAILLANGKPPLKGVIERSLREGPFFLCADGGANAAARMDIRPDLIIGDLDSISRSTLRKFSGVTTRRIADQNSTDLEKALTWLVRKGFKSIEIYGATGGRLDHTMGNLSAIAKFQRKANIVTHDAEGSIYPVLSRFEAEIPKGASVSLLPLTLCEGIVTTGLKWNLRYESLALGMRDGTSNVVSGSPVSIVVRRGTMFLFVRNDSVS